MVMNVNTTPPVENYTVSISAIPGYPVDVTTVNHTQSVNEGMYIVSVSANNIVGSSEKTMVDFSELMNIMLLFHYHN